MRLQVISKYETAIAVLMLIVAAGLSVPRAIAAGDAARGETLSQACLSCHDSEGSRNPDLPYRVPKLGGQKASYLLVALKAYRDGARRDPGMTALAGTLTDQDPVMSPLVSSLSDETVALLAKYYSSLEGLRTTEVK